MIVNCVISLKACLVESNVYKFLMKNDEADFACV